MENLNLNHYISFHSELKETFSSFWGRNPALFIGLSFLLGTSAAFYPHWLLYLFLGLLCYSARGKWGWLLSLLGFLMTCFSASYRFPKTTLSQEKIQGKGLFLIEDIKIQTSPFNKFILYKGTLKRFEALDTTIYQDLPCHIYLPLYGKRPSSSIEYEITGTLSQKADYHFVLKPQKASLWIPSPCSFNLPEWRFKAKQSLSRYLKKEISNPLAGSFLKALATGDIDERILNLEFSKVGLQHILAISGFHFAFVVLFSSFLLRLFLPHRMTAIFLIILLTLYYIFLGNAPSIQRAYIVMMLLTIGQLFSVRSSGLNALGVGLMIELLFNPIVVTHLSFQLTFLCTFAILLFYPLMHRIVAFVLPERSYSETLQMNLLDRHGYILSALLRRTLALNFAVHLTSLPVLLFLFHKFPLLSLIYNLFFPLCVSLSLMLLCTALLFSLGLPLVSHWIHHLNNTFTSSFLVLTSNPPTALDFTIRTQSISFSFVLCFIALSFFIGVIFYEKQRSANMPL